MIDLHFAQPQWIHAIWLVIGLVSVLVWFDHRGSRGLDKFVSATMQKRLVRRPRRSRRLLRVAFLGLSAIFLVLALMQPQSGFHYVQTPRVGAQVMVCLDVSKSMLAQDVAPNRLERAKAEIRDLLTFMDGDHVGLITFAGRATVLCPLTPDFGFLRLALQSAGPTSVPRGGTNLEEPIRKADAGFRGQSDLSRVIILITDGEDHDSFPVEAAKTAAQRGIRIIAIGFGDELGSKVFVTDPRTGARTQLLDGDGKPVMTQLDGETLRQIALETDGAYIPAGTGALDLKSIYNAHIAPLTRGQLDDRTRLVEREQYQWAVLMALASLVAAAAVVTGKAAPTTYLHSTHGSRGTAASVALLSIIVPIPTSASEPLNQNTSSGQVVDQQPGQASLEPSAVGVTPPSESDVQQAQIDPRQVYNQAVSMLKANDLDEAETQFSLARRTAGSDGPTRYRATFNLAWVEVKRADQLIEDQPQEALSHLHAAADWFSDAVHLQPDEPAPRQNLEVIGRRIITLTDALAEHKEQNLTAQLDELVQHQRQLANLLQGTVQRVAVLPQATIPDHLRSEFRGLEVEQRQLLAQVDEVAQLVREESGRLEETPEEQRDAQQQMQIAQLRTVQAFLYQAEQRMGQTRRHMRARQAERAYRRASAALGELKRARDQLRNLVEALTALITDAISLAEQTALYAAHSQQTLQTEHAMPEKPGWLTWEFVEDSLATVRARTDELVARVDLGLASAQTKTDDNPGSSTPSTPSEASEGRETAKELLTILQEASPLFHGARQAFDESAAALTSKRYEETYQTQALAISDLLKARELFLDIRGLIEAMYADQQRIQTLVKPADKDEQTIVGEYLPLLGELQMANKQRAERLDRMIDRQLQTLAADDRVDEESTAPSTTENDARRQQHELAKQLLSLARASFDEIERMIGRLNNADSDDDSDELRVAVYTSVERIEALRALFFSIIEHLRDTARRQVELTDQTRDLATGTDDQQLSDRAGLLLADQQVLSTISAQITESLKKQSEQPVHAPDSSTSETQDQRSVQAAQDAAHRMFVASERVGEAREAMDQAIEHLGNEPITLENAQEPQQTAVEKLGEALALLAPPPPPQEEQQQSQDEQQQQHDSAEGQDQQQEATPQMDMTNLLQAVRDREAQRQRERRSRQVSTYEPVEKDW